MGVMRPNRTNLRGGPKLNNRARRLRAGMTDAERLLWQELRGRQLGRRFRRQFPIPPYVVDFACIEARLIVEADGGQHSRPGDHDERDSRLRRKGWRILRFWNNDVVENCQGVLHTIAAALAPEPPPHPSPTYGGGSIRAGSSPPPQAGEG